MTTFDLYRSLIGDKITKYERDREFRYDGEARNKFRILMRNFLGI
jgi:hypothetical protein